MTGHGVGQADYSGGGTIVAEIRWRGVVGVLPSLNKRPPLEGQPSNV